MKISKKQLKELVREVLSKKFDDTSTLKEASDFTAKRQIIQAAQNASMEFEKEINRLLDLVDPDQLQPELQRRYFAAAESMKNKVVKAVAEAVRDFAQLPRNEKADGGGVGS